MQINPACHTDYNTVTRNVTMMKQNLQTFLQQEPDKPFFLYVGFGDTHRCGFESTIGSFCEFYGSGERGQGVIPDWTPNFFAPEDVVVPPYLPDIPDVREDLAAMYTAQQRLDTGVGLILAELQAAWVLDDCVRSHKHGCLSLRLCGLCCLCCLCVSVVSVSLCLCVPVTLLPCCSVTLFLYPCFLHRCCPPPPSFSRDSW